MLLLSATTENTDWASQVIESEYRLNELAGFTENHGKHPVIIIDKEIMVSPDWEGLQPPLLFPPSAKDHDNLLGLIYYKIGNHEKAYNLLQYNRIYRHIVNLGYSISNQLVIDTASLPEGDFFSLHNKAVALHYGITNPYADHHVIENLYKSALAATAHKEYKLFTVKNYATFLLDSSRFAEAAEILQSYLSEDLSELELAELKSLLCLVWIKQLELKQPPADSTDTLKNTLWECLKYYEKEGNEVKAAMLLSDATQVAAFDKSYSEALGYINRSISIFQKEELKELAGQALMQKGGLLKLWASEGNPQFFRPAIQAYQESLNIFTREYAPDVFAEIHHQLGILYAEVPDDIKKKGVWASVSVSSFNEALNFYNKIDYPYRFAVICSNAGTAYTKFPMALHSDNYDKALAWYREALDVFSALTYPDERTGVLLNYLDASWHAGNKTDFDEKRYEDMKNTAEEILSLSKNENISSIAQHHLNKLQELKAGEKI
jgi:tetratricopeptide (TPR) repeat protein